MAPTQTGAAKTAAGGSSVRGRTKHEQDQLSRKTVYRPVLDNPLIVAWPPLPASVRKSILDHLLPILTAPQGAHKQTVADWRAEEHAARRGRIPNKGKGKGKGKEHAASDDRGLETQSDTQTGLKRAGGEQVTEATSEGEGKVPPTKKRKTSIDSRKAKPATSAIFRPSPSATKTPRVPLPRPSVLDYLSVGINEVTKALETRIRWGRWELGDQKAMPGASQLVQSARDDFLIATAVTPPASSGRTRLRKKANPVAFSPHTSLKLGSIDYSSLPGYGFLANSAPVINVDSVPPYYLPASEDHPSPRLLVNSETLRIKRAVKKEGAQMGQKNLLKKKRPADRELSKGTVESGAIESAGDETERDVSMIAEDDKEDSGRHVDRDVQEREDGEEKDDEDIPTVPVIDLVFVCKPDINPPSLVAHLPGMVAAVNGVQIALDTVLEKAQSTDRNGTIDRKGEAEGMALDPKEELDTKVNSKEDEARPTFGKVKIVPLDQGAERILADALGVRRVAAIGISSSAPGAQELLKIVEQHVQPPLAPWLTPHLLHPPPNPSTTRSQPPPSTFIETHIKHLKTSAPLNPKAKIMEKKAKRKLDKEERRRKKKAKSATREVYEAEDDDDEDD